MLLENKVSIISGIGPGLGQELAYVFAREGSDVVLAARTESKLAAGRRRDRRAVARAAHARRARPTSPTRSRPSASSTRRSTEFGRIDCLVNSAYLPPPFTMFEDADLDDWKRSYDVTVFGTLQLTQQVIPAMKAAGKGSIVFVNSMIQKKPLPTQSGYATSKGALTVAARMLAKELGPYGHPRQLDVHGLDVGPAGRGLRRDGAVSMGRSRDDVIGEITKDIPLGIIPDDADCANAVAFLASDLASVITGAELNVNGGEIMV